MYRARGDHRRSDRRQARGVQMLAEIEALLLQHQQGVLPASLLGKAARRCTTPLNGLSVAQAHALCVANGIGSYPATRLPAPARADRVPMPFCPDNFVPRAKVVI